MTWSTALISFRLNCSKSLASLPKRTRSKMLAVMLAENNIFPVYFPVYYYCENSTLRYIAYMYMEMLVMCCMMYLLVGKKAAFVCYVYITAEYFFLISQFVRKLGSQSRIRHDMGPLEQRGLKVLLKVSTVAAWPSVLKLLYYSTQKQKNIWQS